MSAFGITFARRSSTRFSVASAAGAVRAVAVNTAAVPDLLTFACETSFTSLAFEIRFSSLTRRGSLAEER